MYVYGRDWIGYGLEFSIFLNGLIYEISPPKVEKVPCYFRVPPKRRKAGHFQQNQRKLFDLAWRQSSSDTDLENSTSCVTLNVLWGETQLDIVARSSHATLDVGLGLDVVGVVE